MQTAQVLRAAELLRTREQVRAMLERLNSVAMLPGVSSLELVTKDCHPTILRVNDVAHCIGLDRDAPASFLIDYLIQETKDTLGTIADQLNELGVTD